MRGTTHTGSCHVPSKKDKRHDLIAVVWETTFLSEEEEEVLASFFSSTDSRAAFLSVDKLRNPRVAVAF